MSWPHFRWQVLRTAHFDLDYYPEEESAVREQYGNSFDHRIASPASLACEDISHTAEPLMAHRTDDVLQIFVLEICGRQGLRAHGTILPSEKLGSAIP